MRIYIVWRRRDTFLQTSSLSEKLLQAAQDCKSETVRAVHFQNEANMLKERLESLEKNMTIVEKENAELKSKVTVDATCQTRVTDDNEVSILLLSVETKSKVWNEEKLKRVAFKLAKAPVEWKNSK